MKRRKLEKGSLVLERGLLANGDCPNGWRVSLPRRRAYSSQSGGLILASAAAPAKSRPAERL